MGSSLCGSPWWFFIVLFKILLNFVCFVRFHSESYCFLFVLWGFGSFLFGSPRFFQCFIQNPIDFHLFCNVLVAMIVDVLETSCFVMFLVDRIVDLLKNNNLFCNVFCRQDYGCVETICFVIFCWRPGCRFVEKHFVL